MEPENKIINISDEKNEHFSKKNYQEVHPSKNDILSLLDEDFNEEIVRKIQSPLSSFASEEYRLIEMKCDES